MPCWAAATAGLGLRSLGQRRRVDTVSSRGLDRLGHASDLGAIVGIGGRDVERRQMAEGIDRQMQLRALLALGPIVGDPRSAFGGTVRNSVRGAGFLS